MAVLTEEEVLAQVQEMIRYGVPSALIEIVAMLGFCDVVKQIKDCLYNQHSMLMLNTSISVCTCLSAQRACTDIIT